MRVAFVTPEVYPYSKTGGLADVCAALPGALAGRGIEVTVFSPFYSSARAWLEAQHIPTEQLSLPHELWIGDEPHDVVFHTCRVNGLQLVFVSDPPLFDRDQLYLDDDGQDYHDNLARFSCFCRAVLEYYSHHAPPPDVFHAHDWQAALIPVYLKTSYSRPAYNHTRSLLTVHNLGYQGLFPAEQIYATGLSWDVFTPERLEFYGKLNLLKGGAVYADAVNTVSPEYAEEIQSAEYGHGLEGVMAANHHKLSGILNGIDPRQWDPLTDPHLPTHFSADDLSGKLVCKKLLQRDMRLPIRPKAFLLGAISRLDKQKGIELLLEAFPRLAALDVQLVVLGSGDKYIAESLAALAADYPEQVALRLGFDEPLAHQIEAGVDALLMPSLYEPCGLNQMYSQRYGTLPIVRETGGLKDSVINHTPKRLAEGKASGFTFRQFDAKRLLDTIRRAAALYFTDHKAWTKLVKHVMSIDHSWDARARAYIELYESITPAQLAASGGESGE